MSLEDNKTIVRKMFEAWNRGDLEAVQGYWSSDTINHGRFADSDPRDQRMPRGIDGLRRVLNSLQTAFPDRRWDVTDTIAEGDRVMCRITVSGTHRGIPAMPVEGGPFLQAIQPTGLHYSVQHMHAFRIADGKIAEHWAARDDLALLEELGGLPEPRPVGA
ncbi:MAG: ester cyclase [Chloroflexi bacterium]|nr:ester cyclase [Chloroflexota bacterium]